MFYIYKTAYTGIELLTGEVCMFYIYKTAYTDIELLTGAVCMFYIYNTSLHRHRTTHWNSKYFMHQ